MRAVIGTVVSVATFFVVSPSQTRSPVVRFAFTSDAHYGLTRSTFRGRGAVSAHDVNAALVSDLNARRVHARPAGRAEQTLHESQRRARHQRRPTSSRTCCRTRLLTARQSPKTMRSNRRRGKPSSVSIRTSRHTSTGTRTGTSSTSGADRSGRCRCTRSVSTRR